MIKEASLSARRFAHQHEYAMPALYDAEYGSYQGDLGIFRDIFLRHSQNGEALDLACGTGRITIALAQAGLSCLGIDAQPQMLAQAEIKSKGIPNVRFQCADVRFFDITQRFNLITMAGNSFQAILHDDDQDHLLKRACDHLLPRGFFIFDTRSPLQEELSTEQNFTFWHDFMDPSGEKVHVFGKKEREHGASADMMRYTTKRVWLNHETTTTLTLRFTSMSALQEKITKAGFEILTVFGNDDQSPWVPNKSPRMIFVLTRRA